MRICLVEGCTRKVHAHGYCTKHNHQIERHGRITPERERRRYGKNEQCSIDGCRGKIMANGMCNKHWLHMFRFKKIIDRTIRDRNEIIIHENYAEIILYDQNSNPIDSAIIDIDDVSMVADYKWGLTQGSKQIKYVNSIVGRLHRIIVNAPENMVVDHINHNTLDNRKCNLRVCTQSQNMMNTRPKNNNKSGVTGVYYLTKRKVWVAEINVNRKRIVLKTSIDKDKAVMARKEAERKYFGDFKYKKELSGT